MSSVSRSVYQKLKEENKRLLNDIKTLTYPKFEYPPHRIIIKEKWCKYFEKENQFHELMRAASKQYIKDHADELPDFLTKGTDK